jgi:NAD(P)-dependent dehydrogenase (short-subunit alcohol dehydrogenase family)
MASFDGKKALVTGGASGIGLAIASRLLQENASVVIADIDEAQGQSTAQSLGASFMPLDVSDHRAWSELCEKLDGLDIACLNAGVDTGSSSVADLTDANYRKALGTNVDGVVFGVRSVLGLLDRGGGDICVTASLAGLVPMEDDPIYTLTKHAVIGFVRSVAPELLRSGVRINAVCPGITDTPLIDGPMRTRLESQNFPLIEPQDIAEAAYTAITSGNAGEAWVCQPGREPLSFRFPNVPGPRTEDGRGRKPPTAESKDPA